MKTRVGVWFSYLVGVPYHLLDVVYFYVNQDKSCVFFFFKYNAEKRFLLMFTLLKHQTAPSILHLFYSDLVQRVKPLGFF